VTIGARGPETVAIDADVFEAWRDKRLWPQDEPEPTEVEGCR
jgi:hypothetical protein